MRGLGVSVLGPRRPTPGSGAPDQRPARSCCYSTISMSCASPACHDVLGVVISGIPPGSQAGRGEPFASRHTCHGSGPRVTRSNSLVGDLALDAAGAEQIFAARRHHRRAGRDGDRADRGWPVGLRLAALIAHDGGDEPRVRPVSDRYVADYLYRESLLSQPERRPALPAAHRGSRSPVCAAVRCSRSASRCAAATATTSRPRTSSSSRSTAGASGTAITRCSESSCSVSCAGSSPNGGPEAASAGGGLVRGQRVRRDGPRALAQHDRTRSMCSGWSRSLILPTYQAGLMSTVQRWLAALGDHAIEACTRPLAVLAGWVVPLTGQTADAQRWAAVHRRRLVRPGSVGRPASFESARAMIRSFMSPRVPSRRPGRRGPRREPGPPGALARPGAAACAAKRTCSTGTLEPCRLTCSRSPPRRRAAPRTLIFSSTARRSWP